MSPHAPLCTRVRAASANFILIQLLKKTPVNRPSALDAETSGFKFRYVTVFNVARPRVGARGDDVPFLERS